MISNRTRAALSFDIEITRMISDQIAHHLVQIPLFTDRENRTREKLTGAVRKRQYLGPMLWNIYQNDLLNIQLKSRLSVYADNHQLYDA